MTIRGLLVVMALGLAAVSSGCPKEETTEAVEPQAPDRGDEDGLPGGTHGGSGGAQAESLGRRGPSGFERALTQAGLAPVELEAPPPAPDGLPVEREKKIPFERFLVDIDVPAVLETPVWQMLEMGLRGEMQDEMRCVFEILPLVQTVFIDVALAAGEDEDVVVSWQTTAPTRDIRECVLTVSRDDVGLEPADVGGHEGLASPVEDGDERIALVEAAPGWWLIGGMLRVEETIAAGHAPAEDPAFADAVGPLGPAALRVVLVPGEDYLAGAPGPSDVGPTLGCLVDAWPSVTGYALGAAWRQALELTAAFRHGSADAASETRSCAARIWDVLEGAARQHIVGSTDPRDRALSGPQFEEMLDSFRADADGEFAVVRLRVPTAFLFSILAETM